MRWNKHYEYEGLHAFLGASQYHWLNYDIPKLKETFRNKQNRERGTELHEFAATCIRLRQKLPSSKKTLNMFVNDAIGYKMSPEQVLYFSDNCFGTSDAISFHDNYLRIHDLKTGSTPAHIEQLEIYAALFCLEYGYKPNTIKIELRIYQDNSIIYHIPDPEEIDAIISKILKFDKELNKLKEEL